MTPAIRKALAAHDLAYGVEESVVIEGDTVHCIGWHPSKEVLHQLLAKAEVERNVARADAKRMADALEALIEKAADAGWHRSTTEEAREALAEYRKVGP